MAAKRAMEVMRKREVRIRVVKVGFEGLTEEESVLKDSKAMVDFGVSSSSSSPSSLVGIVVDFLFGDNKESESEFICQNLYFSLNKIKINQYPQWAFKSKISVIWVLFALMAP